MPSAISMSDEFDNDDASKLAQLFEGLFDNLNPEEIKESIDQNGIDKFISNSAGYAAASGVANGLGGFTTALFFLPVDVANNIIQQFRVTLGVIYHKKGVYKVSFSDFLKIVGMSLGVEVGATITKAAMLAIARQILIRLTASTAGKAIPILGALIGGSVNYGFITAIGHSLKSLDIDISS